MDRSIISIREFVLKAVTELGAGQPAGRREAILCRDGYIVGHKFNFDGVRAVWMASQEQINFYADDGTLVRAVNLEERDRAQAA
jgi:hypothetical protein